MSERPFGFAAVQWLIRAVPNGLPGKTRLGRLLLRLFARWKPVRLKDGAGNAFKCPSLEEPVAAGIFTFGQYEPDTAEAILRLLPKGGLFIDIGANIGAITIPIAALRPDVHIVSVEADPTIASLLRDNVGVNKLKNVTVFQGLLGRQIEDSVPFYRVPDRKFGMGSIGPQFDEPPIMIRQVSLSSVLTDLAISQVHVIKIDVEGAELGVLQGAESILCSAHPPAVIFEFSDWAEGRIPGQRPGDAQSYLLAHGYSLCRLGESSLSDPWPARPLTTGGAMIVAFPTSETF